MPWDRWLLSAHSVFYILCLVFCSLFTPPPPTHTHLCVFHIRCCILSFYRGGDDKVKSIETETTDWAPTVCRCYYAYSRWRMPCAEPKTSHWHLHRYDWFTKTTFPFCTSPFFSARIDFEINQGKRYSKKYCLHTHNKQMCKSADCWLFSFTFVFSVPVHCTLYIMYIHNSTKLKLTEARVL